MRHLPFSASEALTYLRTSSPKPMQIKVHHEYADGYKNALMRRRHSRPHLFVHLPMDKDMHYFSPPQKKIHVKCCCNVLFVALPGFLPADPELPERHLLSQISGCLFICSSALKSEVASAAGHGLSGFWPEARLQLLCIKLLGQYCVPCSLLFFGFQLSKHISAVIIPLNGKKHAWAGHAHVFSPFRGSPSSHMCESHSVTHQLVQAERSVATHVPLVSPKGVQPVGAVQLYKLLVYMQCMAFQLPVLLLTVSPLYCRTFACFLAHPNLGAYTRLVS